MGRIIGSKIEGHDSAIFTTNEDNTIYAVSTERFTRRKHDSAYIGFIFDSIPEFKGEEITLAHSFSKDFKRDGAFLAYTYLHIQDDLTLSNIKLNQKERILSLMKNGKFSVLGSVAQFLLYSKVPSLIPSSLAKRYQLYEKKLRSKFSKKGITLKKVEFHDHQLTHAYSAYYSSPFDSCCAVTWDGNGDSSCSKIYDVKKGVFKEIASTKKSYSIGELYCLFTLAMDLDGESDCGKVEALACYGTHKNELYEILKKGITVEDNLTFTFEKSLPSLLQKMYQGPAYRAKQVAYLKTWRKKLGDKDFCAVIQILLEEKGVEWFKKIIKRVKTKKFALAGGVFANVKLNLLLYEKLGCTLSIVPAMADDGTAMGAYLISAEKKGKDLSWLKKETMPYWGDSFTDEEVEQVLKSKKWSSKITYEELDKDWPKKLAKDVSSGKICALFQGRMEYGPRALGNRSILGDPRDPKIRDAINLKFKKRVWYQPFCPSMLYEECERLFVKAYPNKHMTCAFTIKKQYWEKIPSVMHVDHTARPQFVEESDNPTYYAYLKELKKLTGFGVTLNTSFNIHGKTIVRTPSDALTDYLACGLDHLYFGKFKVTRKK